MEEEEALGLIRRRFEGICGLADLLSDLVISAWDLCSNTLEAGDREFMSSGRRRLPTFRLEEVAAFKKLLSDTIGG